MRAHPAAELFPMLPDAALAELARDIDANGLRDPICVWEGMIVDGRNRMAAINKTMRAPLYREMEFKDDSECIRYIISTNIHRRHLTESQRMIIANELAKLTPGNRDAQICASPTLTQQQAADLMQVSRRGVQMAKKVADDAPDLVPKVKSGEIKVSKAASMARERQRQSAPVTNPDNADDAVVEKKIETAASGFTPKMEKVWAGYAALDAVEQTAFRERMGV